MRFAEDPEFVALSELLANWFDTAFSDLREDHKIHLRAALSPLSDEFWDDLTRAQRIAFCSDHDHQHDPQLRSLREFEFNEATAAEGSYNRRIAEWEAVSAETVSDLKERERQIANLTKERVKRRAELASGTNGTPKIEADGAQRRSDIGKHAANVRHRAAREKRALLRATYEEVGAGFHSKNQFAERYGDRYGLQPAVIVRHLKGLPRPKDLKAGPSDSQDSA